MQYIKINGWNLIDSPDDLDGVWITGEELGRHLGYDDPRKQVNRLYSKCAFLLDNNKDTSILKLNLSIGLRSVRVYSFRGVLKLLSRIDIDVFNAKFLNGFYGIIEEYHKTKFRVLNSQQALSEEAKMNALMIYHKALMNECAKDSAIVVAAYMAELAGLVGAKNLLPEICRKPLYTTKELGRILNNRDADIIERALRHLKLHGKNDTHGLHSKLLHDDVYLYDRHVLYALRDELIEEGEIWNIV